VRGFAANRDITTAQPILKATKGVVRLERQQWLFA
jgi:hypothetical protein